LHLIHVRWDTQRIFFPQCLNGCGRLGHEQPEERYCPNKSLVDIDDIDEEDRICRCRMDAYLSKGLDDGSFPGTVTKSSDMRPPAVPAG
jgi:hypothetical protein